MSETTPCPLPATMARSYGEAALRGIRGKCPRCSQARLFRKWLRPVARCPSCAQDWSLQRADDFPPYVSIFLTGHLIAPLIIVLALEYTLPAATILAIILPVATIVMLSILQPAKGAIIAAQWWLGMVGFRKERATLRDSSEAS